MKNYLNQEQAEGLLLREIAKKNKALTKSKKEIEKLENGSTYYYHIDDAHCIDFEKLVF